MRRRGEPAYGREMGFLRNRGDEQVGERFLMREKLLAIGDDFWIENAQGERAYKVNGKAIRFRDTFVLEDASGDEVARIQERKRSIREKIAIERGDDSVATVHKAWSGSGRCCGRGAPARVTRVFGVAPTTSRCS